MPYKARPLMDRFWEKVAKTDTCWNWMAAKHRFGYGKIMVRKRVIEPAHRVCYREQVGPIPEGLQVLHRCDNPACVRPDHLYLGTQADNMRDMHDRGRWRYGPRNQYGENNPSAILTDAQVRSLLADLAIGEGPVSVARKFGISYKTLWAIRSRKAPVY